MADTAKRADRIASEIETELLTRKWPIGHRIGNEGELARAHGVSRWTIREAIAILEQAGILVAKRGANGGLFVAAPAPSLVRNSIAAYLEFSERSFDAISSARMALSRTATRRAMENMSDRDRVALTALILKAEQPGPVAIEAMAQAREKLRHLAHNRALDLFLAALADVGMHSCWMSGLDDDAFVALIDRLTFATRRYCLAVAAEQLESAMEAEAEGIAIADELYAASSVSGRFPSAANAFDRAYALYPSAHPAKKAERVAWALRQQICDERLEPGTVLGSEEALMRRHDVGRPVLREAIRVIERLGLAEMRRGGASGLTVIAPQPSHIIRLARDYLRRDGTSEEERREVVSALEGIERDNPVARLMMAMVKD